MNILPRIKFCAGKQFSTSKSASSPSAKPLGNKRGYLIKNKIQLMDIPDKIGGAKVLQYLIIDHRHTFTQQTKQYSKGKLLGPMYALTICTYNPNEGYYLFGCNEKWESITDTLHDTIDEAIDQAEFEYSGTANSWIKVN